MRKSVFSSLSLIWSRGQSKGFSLAIEFSWPRPRRSRTEFSITRRCRTLPIQFVRYLCDMFAEAVDQNFFIKAPAARVKLQKQLREIDKTTLTWISCGWRSKSMMSATAF